MKGANGGQVAWNIGPDRATLRGKSGNPVRQMAA